MPPPTPEQQLAALYADIARLIRNLLLAAEGRGATGTAGFIAAQAEALRQAVLRLDRLTARWVGEHVSRQYVRSASQAALTLTRAGVPIAQAGFTDFDRRALRALEERVSRDLRAVRTAIGTGLALGSAPRDTARAVRAALQEDGLVQLRAGQPVVRVPSGKLWRVDAYAQMLGRTVVADTRRVAFRERYLANGVDLVRVVANGTNHATCRVWEGELLSLTGATPGVPTVADARAAGLFHPQCRHRYVVATDVEQPPVPLRRPTVPPPEVPLPTLGRPAPTAPRPSQLAEQVRRPRL